MWGRHLRHRGLSPRSPCRESQVPTLGAARTGLPPASPPPWTAAGSATGPFSYLPLCNKRPEPSSCPCPPSLACPSVTWRWWGKGSYLVATQMQGEGPRRPHGGILSSFLPCWTAAGETCVQQLGMGTRGPGKATPAWPGLPGEPTPASFLNSLPAPLPGEICPAPG